MKRALMILVLLSLSNHLLAETLDKKEKNDIGVIAGFNYPMYKDTGEGVVVGLTYSNWTSRGLCFRTGFQYISEIAHVDYALGVPISVAFRSREKETKNRFRDGAYSAAESVQRYRINDNSDNIRNAFFSFLLGLFSNAEFYAGITPGYIIGSDNHCRSSFSRYSEEITYWEESWTEVKNRFSTSLDAGINLNYGIWRFDLKLMPAFHFNVTDNFVIHTSEGNSIEGETLLNEQHIRWFFSISGGLSFIF